MHLAYAPDTFNFKLLIVILIVLSTSGNGMQHATCQTIFDCQIFGALEFDVGIVHSNRRKFSDVIGIIISILVFTAFGIGFL